MASNNSNNTIRESDNEEGHINLTMDDVLNGTINNTINLLLRADNSTDRIGAIEAFDRILQSIER